MTKREYTKAEVQKLFEQAARMPEEPRPEAGYSVETVQHAAKEAGISDTQIARAIRRLESRRASRLVLGLVAGIAAIAIAALLLFPNALSGTGTVLLHNDNRDEAHTAEVLVPLAEAAGQADCGQSPEQRVAASDYCVARRVRLEPRARVRIKIPHRPSNCPQIWVRVLREEVVQSSALFTLPAGIEIDKRGHMDQKGLGRPNMHPSPEGMDRTELSQCPSAGGGAI